MIISSFSEYITIVLLFILLLRNNVTAELEVTFFCYYLVKAFIVWFVSTIEGYLMPNPLYTYKLHIYDLVRLGFMAYQPL